MRMTPELAWAAQHQEHVISRAQALAAGLSAPEIGNELRAGRWRCAYPGRWGVYVLDWGTAPMTSSQWLWAAVLSVGGVVVLSHQSALWAAHRRGSAPWPVEVAVAQRSVRSPEGVRVHVLQRLDDSTVDPWRRPPRLRYAVAAIEAAHTAPDERAALAVVFDAVAAQRTPVVQLADALAARPRHRHRALLESVLVDVAAGAMSGLEREFLHCLRRHGLPTGSRQRREAGPVGARYLDVIFDDRALCLSAPLVTELDGRLGHDLSRERWRDMARDNLDEEKGRGHLRYGAADVFGDGCLVAGQVFRALARRGFTGRPLACRPSCVVLAPPPRAMIT